ncbi:MAG: DUF433 domain-containing protein [Nostocales cyanobacterium]|nr:MAG: DUF433 domain-containing protein [Nostocales cyanobacterium]TAF19325.1 MAG: DUF433 domain-containing protein [Nostocales cyanobacterium]
MLNFSVLVLRKQGADDLELLQNYPSLTSEDLTAAWDYYEQHPSEWDIITL